MLLIRTKVKPSNIPGAGMGLFAAQKVLAGTTVWTYKEEFDRCFKVLPKNPAAKEFIIKYGYKTITGGEDYYLSIDNMRFINHSKNPSVIPQYNGSENANLIAAYDMKVGEELTLNYVLNYRTDDPGSQRFYQ